MGNYLSQETVDKLMGQTDKERARMQRWVKSLRSPVPTPAWAPEPADMPTEQEYMKATWIAEVVELDQSEIRIDQPYVHERDWGDVKRGRVTYPGASLPIAHMIISGEVLL